MVKEDQKTGRASNLRRYPSLVLAGMALAGLAIGIGHMVIASQTPGTAAGGDPQSSDRLFRFWPKDRKPDVAIVLTGEVFGYMQPCGCSAPQYGGLERRYNFLKQINDKGWPVVALDLGDVSQKSGPPRVLKYTYAMEAMKKLGYLAAGIGRNDMEMPLIEGLSMFSLNNPSPRVLAANLVEREDNFPEMLRTTAVAALPNAPIVGSTAVVAPSIGKEVKDPTIKFAALDKALPVALQDLQKQNAELRVLLFEGSLDEARAIAKAFPQFQIILCSSAEDEPPEKPDEVGNTMIVRVGHKGRCLGVVGAFRTQQADKPFKLYYQLVHLGPEYQTPAGQDATNPMITLLDDYAGKVKAENFQYPRTQHVIQSKFPGAKYVGSDKCKRCHEESYKVWKASAHSHAFEALVNAKRPSLRQFDGECIVCHVVGFDINDGFVDEKTTPHLLHVGCESCHGPGSVHVNAMSRSQPNPPGLAALMNPFRTPDNETPQDKATRMRRLSDSCQKCHDTDNDVHWKIEKWSKIEHKEPNLRGGAEGAAPAP